MADLFSPADGATLDAAIAELAAWASTQPPDPMRGTLLIILEQVAQMLRDLLLVRDMRQAQREYFRTKGNLPTCKALESRVDGRLKAWGNSPARGST